VLLTRSRYEGEAEPAWTLPGGRQEPGETKAETVQREFIEEASLQITVGPLLYFSESLDLARKLHVMNCTFSLDESDLNASPRSRDSKVVTVEFVPIAQAPQLLRADVLRIPVAAALSGDLGKRYFCFREADVVEPFFRGAPRAFKG
jgi:8-oxo-dGTP pyrophosphatase MutT (NUDIX family)